MRLRALARTAFSHLGALARNSDGGALVEFTVVVPFLFIFMFGIVEWGNIFYVENNMLIAARQAARAWAVGSVTVAATDVTNVCAAVPLKGSGYKYTFTLTYHAGCASASSPSAPTYGTVTMKITTPAVTASLFNYLGTIGASTNLSASATLQEEFVCPAASGTYSPATPTTC